MEEMQVQESQKLNVDRWFTKDEKYIPIEWTKTDILINDEAGKPLFTQKDSEFPSFYSELSKKIISSRYFYGEPGTEERERSLRQLIGRVTDTFKKWGLKQGYFNEEDAENFRQELAALTVNQKMAFNSPVWFNVGTDRYIKEPSKERKDGFRIDKGRVIPFVIGEDHLYPQTSACFIQNVDDTMEDIMDLAKREATLFKHGSGTGTDLSTLRSSREKLSGGGKPSGPLAYLTFYDKVAGIVKSGGKTRRAAKMNSLRIDHPDIKEFIEAKMKEQKKIEILMDNGIDGMKAIETVSYQNANLSVRVTDEFMNAVENDEEYQTKPVHNTEMSSQMPKYSAKEILNLCAQGTHGCGDPGVQYHDTINKWHTCPNSEEIKASNPCSEYAFVDNSSCNLASLNLRAFVEPDGSFNTKDFANAIRLTAIAQDLLYDNSSFPTEKIAENSHKFRPLGMGYANLGALLMSLGLPYDSEEGRSIAAAITAFLTGRVYETSTEMAEKLGVFEEFEKNKEPMLKVMNKHKMSLESIDRKKLPEGFKHVLDEAKNIWERVIERGKRYGFRNAQATVLAPTGTIGFMMDCDTKGIEPEIGLVQTKLLAEGGRLKIVNGTVKLALEKLGYSSEEITKILKYIRGNETIEGSSLKKEHLPIFDCSNKPSNGKRTIDYMEHIKMMAAVQPFLSGAISKTVNMSKEATIEEIEQVYIDAWKRGLKAIAIYRDGSKRLQPLSFKKKEKGQVPVRKKLPITASSMRHKFNVAGHEGYLHIGMYDDGMPGEIFITMSKQGATMGGLMDSFATSLSMNLQYGVPLETLVNKFKNQRFQPSGMVWEGKKEIKTATSIVDYISKFLEKEFLNGNEEEIKKTKERVDKIEKKDVHSENEKGEFCPVCGAQMIKKGSCEQYCPDCNYYDQTGCGG